MKNPIHLLFFLLASQWAFAQAPEDWTWYTPSIFTASTDGLQWDEEGNLWMSSGSKLIRYDGTDWTSYDFTDAGISLTYNTIQGFAFSSDQKIWCSTYDRVLEFDRAPETWTVHDPSGNQSASNGRCIVVDHQNQVWWSDGSRFYYFDGMEWNFHHFYVPFLEMNTDFATSIRVDASNAKWIATPNSICIDLPGCHIPAGAIRLTDTDTTFFDAVSLGVPDAAQVWIDFKENGDPVAVINDFYTPKTYQTTYSGGTWSAPQEIPLSGWIYDMKIKAGDKVWLAYKQFAATGYLTGNTWDVIHPDLNEINEVYSLETSESETLYLAGRRAGLPGGILGELPKPGYKISGLVYIDQNFNGVHDPSDLPIKNHIVKTSDNSRVTFSNNNGGYNLNFSTSGSYDLETSLPPHFFYGTPPNGMQVVELTSQDTLAEDIHFGLEPDTTAVDLSISLTNLNNANPGFEVCFYIQYKNLVAKVTEAEITCHFDELLTFQSADPAPAAINGNEFTFLPGPLNWMEEGTIKVWFTLPPDGGLAGQVLSHDCLITSLSGPDLDISNNSDALRHTITAPYDPNDISVTPAGYGPKGYISKYTPGLDYTIRFQNVGTDTARNVVISNYIDHDLDILTLQVLGYSHGFEIGYNHENRLLQWIFEDIDLVDSLTNETGSHGFIRYLLAPASEEEGLTLSNQADIYFDFNDPIPTNTVINTLADTLEWTDLHAAVCQGNGYVFGGDTLTEAGIYYDTLLSVAGFDSIVVLHLATDTVFTTTIVAEVCWADGIYIWEGQALYMPGTYQLTHTTSGGCDSIVTLILDFVEYFTRTIEAEICEGETYHFYYQPLTQPGVYTEIIPNYFGYCDSIVTLFLNVDPSYETYLEAEMCQEDTIWFNGTYYTETGLYTDTFHTVSGCDSIFTLNLTLHPHASDTLVIELCEGESYDFNGEILTEAGVYAQYLTTWTGCDSIFTLFLNVYPAFETYLEAALCEGDTIWFNGDFYTEPGHYTDTIQSASGCDSIFTLELTILLPVHDTLNIELCNGESYDFNGQILTEAGVYSQYLVAWTGCDSIVTLFLNVYPAFETYLEAALCEGDTIWFNGDFYTEPGLYTDTLQSASGCDSIFTLELTILLPVQDTLIIELCDGESYDFNGQILTEAGVYSQYLVAWTGCDSTVTLFLDVFPTYETNLELAVCQGDTIYFNGTFFTETGLYSDTLQTVHGCDSIFTINLTVLPPASDTLIIGLCEGESYDFNGEILTETGVYSQYLVAWTGCDSIVTLFLNIHPTYETFVEAVVCEGDTIWFNDAFFTEPGLYTDTLQSVFGCDSILMLDLAVEPEYEIQQEAEIEEGQSYLFGGQQLTEAGSYYDSLLTMQGCDSVIVLHLTVIPPSNATEAEQNGPCSFQFFVQHEVLFITFPSQASREVCIFDMHGRSVTRTMSQQAAVNLSLGDLASGAYILFVRTEGCGRPVSRLFVRIN